MAVKTGTFAFEGFRLDPANALLWRGDARVALAPKPFEVLCRLVDRPGELVTKDELLDAVWSSLHVSDSSLSVAINALRLALGDDPNAPHYIETVTRRGYRFIAPVTVAPTPDGERPPEGRASVPSLVAAFRPRWGVGRTAPLEALESLLQQSLAGNRQVVFITGEAGIGKTTFIEMAMERMSKRGVRVLWGHCIEHFGTDEAFLPLIEALQERCGGADGPLLLKTLRDHAPTWLAQMPGFLDAKDRAAFQSEVFGATRERMLREFCELVEVLSSDRPWVIILEDLHWSDFATLDVLSRFARRDRKASVLVLATYRPIDVMIGGHPIRTIHQDLQIHGRCTELALDRLSRAEVEQYLALRFDEAEMVHALVGRVFRRTQGHPLFVVSLVDYFVAQQAIDEVDGHWHLAPEEAISQEGMPHDLRDMITAQIDRLNADERELLEAASAAGAEFSAAMVAGAMNRNTLEVEQTFEALSRRGHVLTTAGVSEWPDGTVAGCYSIQHALYQDVLYKRLAPGKRVQTHRRLGERLEEGYRARTAEIASVLALHFEEGRDFAKAVRYLGQAAENSVKRFGNREAAIYLTRALALVERLPAGDQLTMRIKLLQQRGWARRSAGDLRGALEDLSAEVSCAAEANQLLVEVKALVDLSWFCLYVDRRQCLEVAERALARSRALDDDVMTALAQGNRASLNLYLRGWRDQDADHCRLALKLTADVRDPFILIRRCSIQTVLAFMNSNYQEGCAAAEHGQALAQERGDAYTFVIFNTLGASLLLHLGAWSEMRQSLVAALAMTEKNATRQISSPFHLTYAWLHNEALDFEGAKKCCEEALDSEVEENPVNFFEGRILLAQAHLGLHDYPAALEQFNAIAHRIEVDGIIMESPCYPVYYRNLCEYWLAMGDLARAREQAMWLYELAARPPERTYLALSHTLLAKIAMAEGGLEEAEIQLSRAISIVEGAELPLVAWRVYVTAAEFYESVGERRKAIEFLSRSEKAIQALTETFEPDDRLRGSFLAGYAVEACNIMAALSRL
jgi:DNA-binding winged helix-turn-helix (wHTH) protein/tetratricopeptide (TPR) repeat protein